VIDIGDIVGDKYRVDRALGNGGMAYVMAATHLTLDRPVAIKILLPGLCENQEAIARFLREARASVRIQGDHVARVIDVGTLDDGAPYMVMDLLEGCDLARDLRDRNTLPIGEAVDFVLQACEALAEAHAFGIVHRDLKPANLFLTRRSDGSPLVKVLDFGISKAFVVEGQTSVTLTDAHGILGSPCYMSPEQVRKPRTVDSRSDIWSLGIILYELIGGLPPFVSDTPMGVLAAVVTDHPPSLVMVRDDVPPGLEDVISKCLEKEASRRYQDVVELAVALKPFAPSGETAVARIAAVARAAKERALFPAHRSSSDAGLRRSSVHPPDAATLKSAASEPPATLQDTAASFDQSGSISASSTSRASSTLPSGRARKMLAGFVGAAATIAMLTLGGLLLRSRPQSATEATSASGSTPASSPSVANPLPLPNDRLANASGASVVPSAASDHRGESDTKAASTAVDAGPSPTNAASPILRPAAAQKKTARPKVDAETSTSPAKSAIPTSLPSPLDPLDGRQ
jgi:serine/threonine protein kinase